MPPLVLRSFIDMLPFVLESGLNRLAVLAFAVALAAVTDMPARALELPPYKERLFGYPGILVPGDDDRYLIVDYRESRDINARDQVPERRVWGRYVSLDVRRQQQELAVDTPSGPLKYFAVGKQAGASVITVYVHGKGGSRKQGVNDYSFGGNFNRLKNLMVRSGGLYLSPDVPAFDATGAAAIAVLVDHYQANSPGAPLILACGSLGAEICYRMAADADMAGRISGFVLLGAPPVSAVLGSAAFNRRVPFFFGHGSLDKVYSIDDVEAQFRRFIKLKPDYPVRFVRFETGTHGTPIRMTDWRSVLNWMLALNKTRQE